MKKNLTKIQSRSFFFSAVFQANDLTAQRITSRPIYRTNINVVGRSYSSLTKGRKKDLINPN